MCHRVSEIPSVSRTGESLVKQDSKQVQVDLQDLGYETCGRSENEAEREESTSPGKAHLPPATPFSLHIWVLLSSPTPEEEERGGGCN